MTFRECVNTKPNILMEGALGERLKREYGLVFDPEIAMAALVETQQGKKALAALWKEYLLAAEQNHLPFLATTPTRRANRQRMEKAGKNQELLLKNVDLLREVRQDAQTEMYVGGLMGCKGDAYTGMGNLTETEAEEFHLWQAEGLRKAGVDFLYAGIMPTLPEAAGMARAMEKTELPYIISFTIRRDGRLIDGTAISDAIGYIDSVTETQPVCYMTNCVHPSIVYEALSQPFNRTKLVESRFWGIQANTSPLDYDALDGAEELFSSAPEELAESMMKLRQISRIKIWGGCCGTDGRHMMEIAKRL